MLFIENCGKVCIHSFTQLTYKLAFFFFITLHYIGMQEAKPFLCDESSMSSFVIQHRVVVSDPDNTTDTTDYDSEVEVG